MMVDLYRNFAAPLADKTMFDWHAMLLTGDASTRVIGGYRTHPEPMQVVSGPIHKRKVHFEAPPPDRLAAEMKRFIAWFNATAPGGNAPLPAPRSRIFTSYASIRSRMVTGASRARLPKRRWRKILGNQA
jgi:hypothetical protein